MAIKVTSTGQTTFVKKIVVGTPVRSTIETGAELDGLSDVLISNVSNSQILIYDSAEGVFKNSDLIGGTGITSTYSNDSDQVTLSITNTGVSAGVYGSVTQIPSISINAQGQIDSASEVEIATTLQITDETGDVGNVSLLTQSLNFVDGVGTTFNINDQNVLVDIGQPVDPEDDVQFNNITVDGQLYGPAIFTIDPASIGDNTGRVVIAGDLQVDGTTTTINSSELSIEDVNIVLASGALDSAGADGAGLTIDGANATFTYNNSSSKWVLNRGLVVSGDLLPNIDSAYDLGSNSAKWKDLHLSGNTIFLGGLKLKDSATQFSVTDSADTPVNFNLEGSIDQIRGFFSAAGDLNYDSSTGEFTFDVEQVYTKANFDSDFNTAIDEASINGIGLSYDSSTNTLSITDTGVIAGEYGSSTQIPVVTVNARGQIDSIGEVLVAGVTGLTYDSATGALTISTADGNSFTDSINLNPFTTSDLIEGSNLYYLRGRADSDAKKAVSATDAGGDGSFSYDAPSGIFTYTGPSASEVRAHFSASGDLSYDSSTGVFSFNVEEVYTKANFDSDLGAALDGGTGITYDSSTDTISITNTGVVAATYGSASQIPVFTVNAQGQLDSAGSVAVAGVTNLVYDSSNGAITISTADGGSFTDSINLNPFSTSDLSEGSNLYYTTVRADSDFDIRLATKSTSNLSEGTNLYYTTVRVDSDIDAAFVAKSTSNLSEGSNLYYTKVRVDSDVAQGFTDRTTTDLSEGTNLYYTTVRSDSDFDIRLATKSTSDLSEGTNLYYTTVRVDSDIDAAFVAKSTDNLSEGSTNLYYTSARADSDAKNAISVTDNGGDGSLSYTPATGVISYTGPSASEVRAHFSGGTGVTITDGEVAIGQSVGTTDDVTFGAVTGDSAIFGEVAFNTSFTDKHIAFQEGALWYDPYHKNLNYYTDFDHPIEIGMQVIERVYNNNGYTILKGQPLYYSGNRTDEAGQESPTVSLANATSASKYNVQGLAAENIPDGSYGQIVVAGVIDGFDTSGLNAGENFFAGLTDGAVQNAAPTYPNYPMCLGWVIKSDSSDGKVIINQQNHSVSSFRVQGDTHISADLRIDGDLIVVGTQTITSTANVEIGGNIQYLNAGDTIGEAGTTFVGTGLDDAFFAGHYSGDSSTKSFFVKIDATGTPDTFEWGFDSSVGTEATGIAITGSAQLLDSDYGIKIDFGATTGHTTGDVWAGTATATDIDTGFFTNRNTGDAGDGYTHVGLFFDVSENKWTFLNDYEPEPEAPINLSAPGLEYGAVKAATFEGNLTGAVTGNASTATTATNVVSTANNTNNETVYITFVDGQTGAQGIETDLQLTYNPSTNTITAGTFSGSGASLTSLNASNISSGTISDDRLPASITSDITGNAATATALATGRTIDVTGVTATGQSFDGTGDINIEVTAVPASLLTGTIDNARISLDAAEIPNLPTSKITSGVFDSARIPFIPGGDADTLGGISSGSFLRSDAADTKTSGDLVFNDNVQLHFGTTSDLKIFHNGTHSFIQDVGTGDLVVMSNQVAIRNATQTEDMARFFANGSVDLYYDNSKKFETTDSGVEVTGYPLITAGALGTSEGDTVELLDAQSTADGNDLRLKIFNERDTAGTDWTTSFTRIQQIVDVTEMSYIQFNGTGKTFGMEFGTNGDELYQKNVRNGQVELYYNGVKKFQTTNTGVSITGTATATTFSGSGASLTSLPAAQLTGTIASARLPDLAVSDFAASAIVTEAEGLASSDNDTSLPTTAAVVDYIANNAGGTDSATVSSIITADVDQAFVNALNANAATVTVADESTDTTCFPLFATAATGNLAPKSGSNLTFNSSSGRLSATEFYSATFKTDDGTLTVDATEGKVVLTNNGNTKLETSSSGIDVNGSVTVGTSDTYVLDAAESTLSTVTQTSLDAWSDTTYGAAKYIVTAVRGVERHITEILVTHDGTTAVATEYGTVTTNGILATYDVNHTGDQVELLATGTSATSTSYKVVKTLIEA